jgi:hypothetical protein
MYGVQTATQNIKHRAHKTKKYKTKTQYVLDSPMRKQTQITLTKDA